MRLSILVSVYLKEQDLGYRLQGLAPEVFVNYHLMHLMHLMRSLTFVGKSGKDCKIAVCCHIAPFLFLLLARLNKLRLILP